MRQVFGFILLAGFVYCLYYFGFSKNTENPTGIVFKNICPDHKMDGKYKLAIFFTEPKNNRLIKQKLELFYEISIIKKECGLKGTGMKNLEITVDTLSKKLKSRPLNEKVNVKGIIDEDNETITLDVQISTDSNNDKKVSVFFPKQNFNAEIIEGTFIEKVGNCKGSAKLTKVGL